MVCQEFSWPTTRTNLIVYAVPFHVWVCVNCVMCPFIEWKWNKDTERNLCVIRFYYYFVLLVSCFCCWMCVVRYKSFCVYPWNNTSHKWARLTSTPRQVTHWNRYYYTNTYVHCVLFGMTGNQLIITHRVITSSAIEHLYHYGTSESRVTTRTNLAHTSKIDNNRTHAVQVTMSPALFSYWKKFEFVWTFYLINKMMLLHSACAANEWRRCHQPHQQIK